MWSVALPGLVLCHPAVVARKVAIVGVSGDTELGAFLERGGIMETLRTSPLS